MLSNAALSPKSKGVMDIEQRIQRLEAYAKWGEATQINFEEVVGSDDWRRHWDNWQQILDAMATAQELADSIKRAVAQAHYSHAKSAGLC